jgi:hypothetical protein
MAGPGFSITELIQALGKVKDIYDAFCNEYTSSASQLRDLNNDIHQFHTNLEHHKKILVARGLGYSGYEAVQRTLEQCRKFLEPYDVVKKGRKMSAMGALKTVQFVFEEKEINRLRDQISRHQNSLLQHSVNIVL